MPGFSAEEVKVTRERGTLTVRAEHADTSAKPGESDGRTFFARELARGVVSRSVLIGDAYDPDSISGSLKNGGLRFSRWGPPGELTAFGCAPHARPMANRLFAIIPDPDARTQIDLLRALYDRALVDTLPPHVPILGPLDDDTSLSSLTELMGLIVGGQSPFLLELAQVQSTAEEGGHLLQFVAQKGADESRRLADALHRDLFPHLGDTLPPRSRFALTVGRFETEREAGRAVAALEGKTYFLVVSQVGILEAQPSGGWALERSVELGAMRLDLA